MVELKQDKTKLSDLRKKGGKKVEKISVERLQEILLNHKLWIDSGCIKGERANLVGAYLRGANLVGANLRGANLHGANLRGANLHGANLVGANLRGANLHGANLVGAYLRGANLRGANLHGANLVGAYLRGANLHGADLRGANLRGANLRGANLRGANLRGADLRGANLHGAYLGGAYLGGAYLGDAYLVGANGEKIEIKKAPIQISNLYWFVTIWDSYMQIGCEFHSHEEWGQFDEASIKDMDGNALEFWAEWKTILLGICEKHRK